jgi:hypothetical protein
MSVRTTSLFVILLGHLLFPKTSSTQLAPANETYTLRGTVVNSVTDEPIQRVLVELSGDRQRHFLTGADGKFEFQNVPPGLTALGLQKPGYFPAQTLSRKGTPTLVTVGPDQPPALLKLIPEAVISGRVLGENGEPVESLPVKVFGQQLQNGKKEWNIVSSAETDDLGEFRCANLQPGRYYVFAGPSPWPASFVPHARVQARSRMHSLGGGRPAAHGYPGFFYPAAEARESATPIEIKAGQHIEINFNVASQIFHTISGTVIGYPTGQVGLNLEATNAAGMQINADFSFDEKTGTFKTQWLPPGYYMLSAALSDSEGHVSYASLNVNLASDLNGVRLQLQPAATIPVTFQVEKTKSGSQDVGLSSITWQGPGGMKHREGYEPARVVLTHLDDSKKEEQQFSSQLSRTENSGSEIEGLPPGTYSVKVDAYGQYYVASAYCGSVNLLEQNLTVSAGAAVQPIKIVLRDDFGELKGSVSLPTGAESAMVFVIPEVAGRRVQNFQWSRAFMTQLAPGTYRVLAVDRAEDFDYDDPEVLGKYADKGRQVTISANQQAEIALDVVHIED